MGIAFTPPKSCLVVVVDIQDKLSRVMPGIDGLCERTGAFLQACRLLEVPVVISEQYPQGLGRTLPAIADAVGTLAGSFCKTTFSCCGSELASLLASHAPATVVLVGMETHVCVQQTALQLRQQGYGVIVLQDCVCSRRQEDRDVALQLLQARGVQLTTMEALLFDWLADARHPTFKAVSKLLR